MYIIMIAMGSLRKKEQLSVEICHLCKGFETLTINNKKEVLKTARGLLRIQRVCKTITADNTRYVSLKDKNETK